MTPRLVPTLLLLAALTGCSAGASVSVRHDPAPTSEAPSRRVIPPTDLAEGRHYARITAYDADERALTVDVVEWFEGDAAVAAAVADGHAAAAVANDYYIRNTSKRLRTITVRAGADIEVNTLAYAKTGSSTKATVITGAELAAYVDAGTAQHALFWFEVYAGDIVTLQEQYLP